MDKYLMWNHYERLHNHNKAKHNKTVCIFIGIYSIRSCRDDLVRVPYMYGTRQVLPVSKTGIVYSCDERDPDDLDI